LGAERAVLEKTLLEVQKDNAVLKQALEDQQRTLHQLQQTLQTADRERQAAAAAQERRIEDLLKQAPRTPPPAVTRSTPAPKPAPRMGPQAPPALTRAVAPPSPTPAPPEASARIRILRS